MSDSDQVAESLAANERQRQYETQLNIAKSLGEIQGQLQEITKALEGISSAIQSAVAQSARR